MRSSGEEVEAGLVARALGHILASSCTNDPSVQRKLARKIKTKQENSTLLDFSVNFSHTSCLNSDWLTPATWSLPQSQFVLCSYFFWFPFTFFFPLHLQVPDLIPSWPAFSFLSCRSPDSLKKSCAVLHNKFLSNVDQCRDDIGFIIPSVGALRLWT